jgi:hypothetical protein
MSPEIPAVLRPSPARRAAIAALILATSLFAFALRASAQSPILSGDHFELRPYVGAYIPTGDQRTFLKDAVLAGGQFSWRFNPALALTGTFAWSPSKDRLTPGNQTLDLYQYDIGAEARPSSVAQAGWLDFSPFVGLGAGGRTYNYRDLSVSTQTNFDGYGALGSDIGLGPVGLRIEGRDYVSRFTPATGGSAGTRNDVTLAAGLIVHF